MTAEDRENRLTIIPWVAWYKSKGISRDTARRLLQRGEGPPIVRLSERRKGVRVIDDIAWTEARVTRV
jgi:hypothetical protein